MSTTDDLRARALMSLGLPATPMVPNHHYPAGLPSFSARFHEDDGPHVRVLIYAGPDAQHRANCGSLTMRKPEADAFESILRNSGVEISRT